MIDHGTSDVGRYADYARTLRTSTFSGWGEMRTRETAALTAYDPECDAEGRIPPIAREIVDVIAQSLA